MRHNMAQIFLFQYIRNPNKTVDDTGISLEEKWHKIIQV